ncbi:hypothetical protein JB92DRAFT_3102636 [Gautieria morchelliformis]|nr:hypothetical protein JB92DRAFT_3102636 [Gautieria morchelliformis]
MMATGAPTWSIAKRAPWPKTHVRTLIKIHGAVDFVPALQAYLNEYVPKCCVTASTQRDTIRATPGHLNPGRKNPEPDHFDCVLVHEDDMAEDVRIKGYRTARVRALFRLPSWFECANTLAYIEWFTPFNHWLSHCVPALSAVLSNDTGVSPRISAHTDSRPDMDTFLQILDLDNKNHGFNSGMAWAHFDQAAAPFWDMHSVSCSAHAGKQHLGEMWDVDADMQLDVEEGHDAAKGGEGRTFNFTTELHCASSSKILQSQMTMIQLGSVERDVPFNLKRQEKET